MDITPKMVEEFKKIYRNERGKELSDQEAWEAGHNLINYVSLIWDISSKDSQRKQRLKKEPGGFPVDSTYSCLVCHTTINPETGWYDWYGQTCIPCRNAIQNGSIPAFVCTERESYFMVWQLKSTFGITRAQVNKHIKEGRLTPRKVLNENGAVHEYIFLKKENPGLIERHSPERKSYDRHRDKEHKAWARVELRKWKEEMKSKSKIKRAH